MFMFTMNGRVQHWEHGERRGMVLSQTRDDARAVANWFQKNGKGKVSIAEVGTIDGETLEDQLEASREYGANCAFVCRVVNGEIEATILNPSPAA